MLCLYSVEGRILCYFRPALHPTPSFYWLPHWGELPPRSFNPEDN